MPKRTQSAISPWLSHSLAVAGGFVLGFAVFSDSFSASSETILQATRPTAVGAEANSGRGASTVGDTPAVLQPGVIERTEIQAAALQALPELTTARPATTTSSAATANIGAPTTGAVTERPNQRVSFQSFEAQRLRERILIFTHGKVGSTSLQWSLAEVFKIYNSKGRIEIPFHFKKLGNYGRGSDTHDPNMAQDILGKAQAGDRYWIVTATRNPWYHLMSTYFELLAGRMKTALTWSDDELIADFRKWRAGPADQTAHWWTRHFMRGTGIDILKYADKFDHDKHRLFIDTDGPNGSRISVVLLHFEDISKWNSILSEFFPAFKMRKVRTSHNRWYSPLYQRLKSNFVYTAEEAQQLRDAQSWAFYSEAEKAKMPEAKFIKDGS
eukprot:TRINITY_DN18113_c0_g1_i4.p1 TRINITY_DN18113_c0_g1~~TRINITY_DN18113_c0_g1_i4.p1  ORF type:complete len:394 (-),score=56.89 TRINITY_DN18113_c0_g1_i4:296-1447(-)